MREVPSSFLLLKYNSFRNIQLISIVFYFQLIIPPTHPLRPIKRNNTSATRITAAAGTRIGQRFFLVLVIIFTKRRALRSLYLRSLCGYCWVKLSLIAQDSPLLPPKGARALSQSLCGCTSSKNSYACLAW